jgi:glycosyltransferase involved in cell wall biosynthesis
MGLREHGHDVLVFTGKPNYPGGQFFEGYSMFGGALDKFAAIDVVRVPLVPRGRGGGGRLFINYLSFAFFACLLAPFRCKGKFDAILVFQLSPVTAGLPAVVLKVIKRSPILFWVQDLWPQSLSATGAIRASWVLGAVDRLVRWIYARCDLLLVQSRAFVGAVEEQGVPNSRIRYFPNTAEAFYRPIVASRTMAQGDNWPDGFRILFAGNIGAAQDFPAILEAAERLRSISSIQWIVVGEGRLRDWVQTEIVRRDLGRCVHLFEGRSPEDMPGLFARADALLVTLRDDQIFEYTIPSKIQSYLACGRPIIGALGGEGGRVLAESGAAFVAAPGNSEALASAVLAAYQASPEQRNEMGSRGLQYFSSHFEREWLLREFDSFLDELAGKRTCGS